MLSPPRKKVVTNTLCSFCYYVSLNITFSPVTKLFNVTLFHITSFAAHAAVSPLHYIVPYISPCNQTLLCYIVLFFKSWVRNSAFSVLVLSCFQFHMTNLATNAAVSPLHNTEQVKKCCSEPVENFQYIQHFPFFHKYYLQVAQYTVWMVVLISATFTTKVHLISHSRLGHRVKSGMETAAVYELRSQSFWL